MDTQAQAVRLGWLPFYPQFDRSSLELVREAEAAGAKTDAGDLAHWVVKQLKDGPLRFAVEDPDAPENWPRLWFIWRGNALSRRAKGHEYFLRHYLGTHSQRDRRRDAPRDDVDEVVWHEPRRRARSTWWSTSTSAWTPPRSTPTSSCRRRPGTRRTT